MTTNDEVLEIVALYSSEDTVNHELATVLLSQQPKLRRKVANYLKKTYGWEKLFVIKKLQKSVRGLDWFFATHMDFSWQDNFVINKLFPPHLVSLSFYLNRGFQLTNLPSRLKNLDCYDNDLAELPKLPETLKWLNCNTNDLIALPTLPNSLEKLHCSCNAIVSLPQLPAKLEVLVCASNELKVLPTLPIELNYLDCHKNALTILPSLPASLETLDCSYNPLEQLPELPNGLKTLYIEKTNLTSLPMLPDALDRIQISTSQLPMLRKALNHRNPASELNVVVVNRKHDFELWEFPKHHAIKITRRLTTFLKKMDALAVAFKKTKKLGDVIEQRNLKVQAQKLFGKLSANKDLAQQLETYASYCKWAKEGMYHVPEFDTGYDWLFGQSFSYTRTDDEKLGNNLPMGLKNLSCDCNRLKCLPKKLPPFLEMLNCIDNDLEEELPTLPATLRYLYIDKAAKDLIPDDLPVNLTISFH